MNGRNVKVSEMTKRMIDWAVAVTEGYEMERPKDLQMVNESYHRILIDPPQSCEQYAYRPTEDWKIAGPIIEREGVSVIRCAYGWVANIDGLIPQYGITPLIAAMRCYVHSVYGEEMYVPEEVL